MRRKNKLSSKVRRIIKSVAANDPSIHVVNLASKGIGDDGAKKLAEALRGNATVTKLLLRNNHIGAEGARALAEALRHNTVVTTIDLQSNDIGAEGAKALAEALKQNSTITTLDLESNSIGVKGVKALADALRHNSTVTKLDLWGNGIGAEGAKALAGALLHNSAITWLSLWGNGIGADLEAKLERLVRINRESASSQDAHRRKVAEFGLPPMGNSASELSEGELNAVEGAGVGLVDASMFVQVEPERSERGLRGLPPNARPPPQTKRRENPKNETRGGELGGEANGGPPSAEGRARPPTTFPPHANRRKGGRENGTRGEEERTSRTRPPPFPRGGEARRAAARRDGPGANERAFAPPSAAGRIKKRGGTTERASVDFPRPDRPASERRGEASEASPRGLPPVRTRAPRTQKAGGKFENETRGELDGEGRRRLAFRGPKGGRPPTTSPRARGEPPKGERGGKTERAGGEKERAGTGSARAARPPPFPRGGGARRAPRRDEPGANAGAPAPRSASDGGYIRGVRRQRQNAGQSDDARPRRSAHVAAAGGGRDNGTERRSAPTQSTMAVPAERTSKFYANLVKEDKCNINLKITELIPLIEDVHDAVLFYTLVNFSYKSGGIATVDWSRIVAGGLRTVSTATACPKSIALFRLLLDKAFEDGALTGMEKNELDREAEVTRTSHAPLVQELRERIVANTAGIDGLDGSVEALDKSVEKFKSGIRRQGRVQTAVGLMGAVLNALSFGAAGSALSGAVSATIGCIVDFGDVAHIQAAVASVGDASVKEAFEAGLSLAGDPFADQKLQEATKEGNPIVTIAFAAKVIDYGIRLLERAHGSQPSHALGGVALASESPAKKKPAVPLVARLRSLEDQLLPGEVAPYVLGWVSCLEELMFGSTQEGTLLERVAHLEKELGVD